MLTVLKVYAELADSADLPGPGVHLEDGDGGQYDAKVISFCTFVDEEVDLRKNH